MDQINMLLGGILAAIFAYMVFSFWFHTKPAKVRNSDKKSKVNHQNQRQNSNSHQKSKIPFADQEYQEAMLRQRQGVKKVNTEHEPIPLTRTRKGH